MKADFLIFENRAEQAAILAANELEPIELSDNEVSDLLAFLRALTPTDEA